jgi:hypothetical protein
MGQVQHALARLHFGPVLSVLLQQNRDSSGLYQNIALMNAIYGTAPCCWLPEVDCAGGRCSRYPQRCICRQSNGALRTRWAGFDVACLFAVEDTNGNRNDDPARAGTGTLDADNCLTEEGTIVRKMGAGGEESLFSAGWSLRSPAASTFIRCQKIAPEAAVLLRRWNSPQTAGHHTILVRPARPVARVRGASRQPKPLFRPR